MCEANLHVANDCAEQPDLDGGEHNDGDTGDQYRIPDGVFRDVFGADGVGHGCHERDGVERLCFHWGLGSGGRDPDGGSNLANQRAKVIRGDVQPDESPRGAGIPG
eukprot:3799601-Rhodomonas_salina.1